MSGPRMRRWLTLGLFLAVAVGSAADGHAQPNAEIIFTSAQPQLGPPSGDLYAIRPDGSHLRLVTQDAADAGVSRDGSRIAFVRGADIWVMQRDGSHPRRVTDPHPNSPLQQFHHAFGDEAPAWSPDGKTIYFARMDWQLIRMALYSIGADGSGQRQLTRPPAHTGHAGDEGDCDEKPSVEPNGALVVYTLRSSCNYGDAVIRAITPDGKPARLRLRMPLPDDFGPSFFDAVWDPRGGEIAYAVHQYNPDVVGLYVSGVNGARARVVIRTCTRDQVSAPAWSPDGAWLAFACNHAIWVVRKDGSELRQVTKSSVRASAPAWLPGQ